MRRGLRGLRRRLSGPATLRRAVAERGRPSIASVRLARARPRADWGERDDAATVRRGMTAYVGPPSQLFPGLLHFVRIGRRTTAAALCNKRIGQGVHAHAAQGLCAARHDITMRQTTRCRGAARARDSSIRWPSPTWSSETRQSTSLKPAARGRDPGLGATAERWDEARVGRRSRLVPASGRASPGGLVLPELIAGHSARADPP